MLVLVVKRRHRANSLLDVRGYCACMHAFSVKELRERAEQHLMITFPVGIQKSMLF